MRTWRILSTNFNSKETTYLLFLYERLFTLLVKLLDEVYYCQTKRVWDKYKFLLSQFVQWCSLVCSVKNAFKVMSTSTEKLSSPCHNQWFNIVSTNLGTSLRFDHNNEKMCVFSRSPDLFFGKLFDWWAMSLWHLWNVSRTLKEFTLPVIFSSLSQQRNRHC